MSIPYTKPIDWEDGFAGTNPEEHENKNYRWSVRYYSALYRAWPKWSTNDSRIRDIYKEAENRRELGEDVQVDHIVPITSKLVCGLHVIENLQIILSGANASKSNKWWPNHPFEIIDLFQCAK